MGRCLYNLRHYRLATDLRVEIETQQDIPTTCGDKGRFFDTSLH